MDYTKLVAMFETSSLHFTRSDHFDDPFEGSLTLMDVTNATLRFPNKAREAMSTFARYYRTCAAMNCWHINEEESAAMWSLYLSSGEGIAITSSYELLKDAVANYKEAVFIGLVKYIDYRVESVEPAMHSYAPFFHKRKSFGHERELRLFVENIPINTKGPSFDYKTDGIPAEGIDIEVDLAELITTLHVAPNSAPWYRSLVEKTVARFGFSFPVKQSALDESPVF